MVWERWWRGTKRAHDTVSAARGRVGNAMTAPISTPPASDGQPAGPASVRGFERTSVWIFDLDNTLYPGECNLFAQVDHRMGEFVARLLGVPYIHARHIQKTYYRQYGTTLTGLMKIHKVNPTDFLEYVHDIDLSAVDAHPGLAAAIEQLPGRRLIFTNGSRRHAERVAEKVGILHLFEDICDIEACSYVPKPDPESFDRMVRAHGVQSSQAAMFEDMSPNLEAPHALGMTTVLVRSGYMDHPSHRKGVKIGALPEHVHHVTDDLAAFLDGVLRKMNGRDVADAVGNPPPAH